eukprot:scaffold603_cov404-Prasinococcus_capsulatus_cf.AAC.5
MASGAVTGMRGRARLTSVLLLPKRDVPCDHRAGVQLGPPPVPLHGPESSGWRAVGHCGQRPGHHGADDHGGHGGGSIQLTRLA